MWCTCWLFIVTGGHLMLINAVVMSFDAFPVGLVGMLLTLPMMQLPFTMALERMLQYFR